MAFRRLVSDRIFVARAIGKLRSLPQSLSGKAWDRLHCKVRAAGRQVNANPAVLDHFLRAAHNVRVGQTWPASNTAPGGSSRWYDHLTQSLLQVVLWSAVALAVSALAVAAVRRWRGDAYEGQPGANELLTKFRELHGRGGLSDDEYRTIKTTLATQLDAELNDTKQKS